jgi:signal transduction histidine kinase
MEQIQDNPYKILVVDDIPDNITIISNILYDKNIEIFTSRNGKQALKIASVRDLDLILLDIAMPEMDGYEVCQKLKDDAKTKSIPIIFLTAKVQPEDIVKGFEVGAVDYITKPFNSSELIVRVHNHLDRKRSQDLIQAQNQQLKELNATKDKFFSLITNDFKAPFSELMDYTTDLVINFDTYQINKIKTLSVYIHEATKKGFNLLEKLIEWSRLQRGKIKFSPELFNLSLIIEEKVEEFLPYAQVKNIKLFYESTGDFYVFADEHMVRFILGNLIHNAIKFTNSGGDIIISTKDADENVEITVYDTGVGIRKDDQPKLFQQELFYTTRGTSNETGTGIGLIICKEFINRNSGKIWVESMEGIGSDFKFTLPKQEPQEP